jgi:hypothetical protein
MTRRGGDDIWDDWLKVARTAKRPAKAPRPSGGQVGPPIGMALFACFVVVVAVLGLRFSGQGSGTATASTYSTPIPSQSTLRPSPSEVLSPSVHPGTSAPALFSTPGVVSNWKGFAWSQLPSGSALTTVDPGLQLVTWRGGYVLYGTTQGGAQAVVWVSADGTAWVQAAIPAAARILVAVSPSGLIAISGDPTQASSTQAVWTSSDGLTWRNAGAPAGLGSIDSLAGTSRGLVVVGHVLEGSGKTATPRYGIEYSVDGSSWTPVTLGPGQIWNADYAPLVQAGQDRFFLLAAQAGGAGTTGTQLSGVVWWSDDGRTWTRSTGTIPDPGQVLDFGSAGILLHTRSPAVPGGEGLLLTRDGGKSWQADSSFGPLGAAVCGQGECSTQPDGVIASNAATFLALKSDGRAWLSADGRAWNAIAWNGPRPDAGSVLMLPRGVVVGDQYGAAT